MTEAPKRVRVTADTPPRRSSAATRGIALPGAPVAEADAVYARALMRSQLRLALGTVAGFVVVVVAQRFGIEAGQAALAEGRRCRGTRLVTRICHRPPRYQSKTTVLLPWTSTRSSK